MPRLAPEEVENILRWYLMDGPNLSRTLDWFPGQTSSDRLGLTHHIRVGMVLTRCKYKIETVVDRRLQCLPVVYLAVRAELEYEKACRQFDEAGRQGAGAVFVRRDKEVMTFLELLRREMNKNWKDCVKYREHVMFGRCMRWLAEELWLEGQKDQSFLPAVMGG